MIKSLHFI